MVWGMKSKTCRRNNFYRVIKTLFLAFPTVFVFSLIAPQQAYAATIVDLDYETGDLSQFSYTSTNGGKMSVAAGAAMNGTGYGLQFQVTSTTTMYGYKDLTTGDTSGELSAGFYFDPNSLAMANNDLFGLLYLSSNAGSNYIAMLEMQYIAGSGYKIRTNIYNDSGGTSATAYYTISDNPHYIEIQLRRATSSTSGDGSVQLWVDGTFKETKGGIDNYDRFNAFQRVYVAANGLDSGTSGTFYFDELVINNDIPPYVPATRYVNADSDGSANNPTRAFSDPGYTANDSYQTIAAAYEFTNPGDTMEISGGTSGNTYAGPSTYLSKQFTLKGSSISNHNGTVTIAYDATTTYALWLNGAGTVLQNVTLTGLNTGTVLYVTANNVTVKDVILKNPGDLKYGLKTYTDSGTTNLINLVIAGELFQSRGIYIAGHGSTANFSNCTVNNVSIGLDATDNDTANFTNCAITGLYQNLFRTFGSGVTVNTTNSLLQAPLYTPKVYTTTAGAELPTWNSSNDILDGFPYYQRTKANMGFFAFSVDDAVNIDYCVTVANYAMSTYGIPITCFISNTDTLTASQKTKLQTLYKQGHDIGVHGRHHTGLSTLIGIRVTYSGPNADMAAVVSGSGTSFSVTGSGDTHGPLDLTSAAYDTVGELCTAIGTWTNFACTKDSNVNTDTPTRTLKDASTSLPISTATLLSFDDSTDASNRFYTEEITNAINDLEAAIHEDPASASYTVKSLGFPYGVSTAAALTWMRTHTNLLGARACDVGTGADRVSLDSFNIFNASETYTGDTVGDGSKASLEATARIFATNISNGRFSGDLTHFEAEMTHEQWGWMIDEMVKYKTAYNLDINSYANLFTEVRTSGNWTDAGSGIWTRTFTGSDDFRLKPASSMINAGATVAGRTTDILGNPIVGTPDIGAYEFQVPDGPTSLGQYASDGTTAISSGSYAGGTTAVFKFSMSSANVTDSLTPEIEIQPLGTAFAGSATNTGTAVAYSGTPVTASVNVTGLTGGTQYHWQARISNTVGGSSWVEMGGSPDFIAGTEPAPTPTTTPTSTASTVTSVISTATSSPPVCSDKSPGTTAPWLYEAIPQGDSTIMLNFTEADSPVTTYVLEYGTASGNYPYGVQNIGVNESDRMSFEVKSLDSDTTYYFRIRAQNGCAPGDWSNELSAKTEGIISVKRLAFTQSAMEPVSKQPTCKTYTVTSGDSLWSIARNELGGGSRFSEIIADNKKTYPTLETSENLLPGWELKINCGAKRTDTPAGKYTVNIKVVDAKKQPVEGASVTIHSNPQTSKTDKNGIARFENVEPGDHTILIAYEAYEGQQTINLQGEVKEFALNVTVKKQTLSLSPLALGIIGIMGIINVVLTLTIIKVTRRKQ